jgi:alkylhydroperoxidase/carboxymuconolactone decarboxylase family protein YurZ
VGAFVVTPEQHELLRRLSINDESVTMDAVATCVPPSELDPKICALTRIAALIASDSTVSSYQWAADEALANGALEAEIVGVLRAVAPVVGLARVVAAAPRLALALGYDVEQALES